MKQRLKATFADATIDTEARTVEVVFYAGDQVMRGGFFEAPFQMVFDFEGVDLAALNDGTAPVLHAHNTASALDVVGNVVEGSARVEMGKRVEVADGVSYVEGKGYATLQYLDLPDVEPIWQRVAKRAMRQVSMGADVGLVDHVKAEDRTDGGQYDLVIAREWSVFEISPVPLGASRGAQTLGESGEDTPCIVNQVGASTMNKPEAAVAAQTTETQPSPAPAAPVVDAAKLAAKAAEDARNELLQRQGEVREYAERLALDVQKCEALANDLRLSMDDVRKRLLEMAAEKQAKLSPEPPVRIEGGIDGREKLAEAIEGAIYRRIDVGTYDPHTYQEMKRVGVGSKARLIEDTKETERMRKLLSAGNDLVGLSIMELGRKALEAAGWRLEGLGRQQMCRLALAGGDIPREFERYAPRGQSLAMSTSDFPKILGNIANKRLLQAYQSAPAFYEQLAWRYDVPDFKTFSIPVRGDLPEPETVVEGGTYKSKIIGERGETGKAKKKGYILHFTSESMINDDLMAFELTPTEVAESFRSEEQGQFCDLVEDNTSLLTNSDKTTGVTFTTGFNTLTSTSAAPGVDSAALVQSTLASQRGIDGNTGRPRNLQVYAVLGPHTLRRALEVSFGPIVNTPDALSNTRQPSLVLGGDRVFTDVRMAAKAWYAFADPSLAPIISYGYLRGEPAVATETRNGWEVDGMEMKCRRVMHFTKVGRVGAVKNAGT